MTIWVLILSVGTSVTTHEFNNEERCIAAKTAFEQTASAKRFFSFAMCVKK